MKLSRSSLKSKGGLIFPPIWSSIAFMDEHISRLNTLFDEVQQNICDFQLFQKIHDYLDFIIKTPELSNIITKECSKLKHKNAEVNHDPILERYAKEQMLNRNSRNSIYTSYMHLYRRVYLPIDDHNKGTQLSIEDAHQIYYFGGTKNIPNEKERLFAEQQLQSNCKMYKERLTDFHSRFLALIPPTPKIIKEKFKLEFDRENSVLKINNKVVRIKQKSDKPNSHYILEYIFDNEEGLKTQSYYTDIIEAKFFAENLEWRSLYRACNDINKKVSEQGGINNFLIIKTGKYGYTQINPEFL